MSTFKQELIVIAEVESNKAGLGRLVFIDDYIVELGGIYVFELYQNKGIAREIVKFLIANVAVADYI